ncbi:PREDICTED: GDSL esterase/lipase At1g23500-like [Tarenaya hassleriana]|uniref:GDSL esterase/lipase At1g23500-like n=1 Tax=Tarenaya hassleriana TaxID=28532 RepID=UPI00053C66C8|nr:PREDICTED: GDSL esterase/lipase At1g23500-like [Tarenaya hassleriana]
MNFLVLTLKRRSFFSTMLFALIAACFIFAVPAAGAKAFPAIFAFGDSILDTGNNNLLFTVSKCNFPPYGRNFPLKRPTGRFGNGRVFSDFVADGLGIKRFVPAFRRHPASRELRTGVCFASGGSGLDPVTSRIQGVIHVNDQVKDFAKYKARLRGVVGTEAGVRNIVSKAVFLISAGNNDLGITYYSTTLRSLQATPGLYTTRLVTWSNHLFKNLYNEGARKFAVMGTLPLGCLPGARNSIAGGPLRMCSLWVNRGAQSFNSKLEAEVKKLQLTLPGSKFVYLDMYTPIHNIVKNPMRHGFTHVADGCCCMPTRPLPCIDVNRYVFWDFAHPTEKVYKIISPPIVAKIKKSLA